MTSFHIDKIIYPKVAIVKAAHRFLNDYYIFLESDDKDFIINWQPKNGDLKDNKFEMEYKNELLTQLIRYEVFQQTKTIRQLTLARAFASSMYATSQSEDNNAKTNADITFNIDAVLSDWSKNEDS